MADVNWNLYDELMMRLYDNRNSLEFDTWTNFTESISKLGGGYWGSGEDEAFYGRGVAQLLADKYAVDVPSADAESAPTEADAMVLLMRKVIESEPYGLGFWRPDGDGALFASSRDADTWYEDYEEMLAAEGLGEPAADDGQATADAAEAAEDEDEEEEVIKPYGLGFMKLVEGRWRFGSSPEAEKWYGDYDEMLVREHVETEPAAQEIIEPYGLGFMKAVEGQWRFGSKEDAEKWYADYSEMLKAEGLSQPEGEEALAGPVHVPDAVASLDLGGIDPRAFQPDADLSPEEAEAAFDDAPAAQNLVEWIAGDLAETYDALIDQLLDEEAEGLDPDDLSQLADGLAAR